ncbi:hypothetical protein B1200_08770 [Escherichia coli]|nr:hypothetical protein B1200_08770 [Escherichia coli]
MCFYFSAFSHYRYRFVGNDSNLLIVFYVQIMPDDFVMQWICPYISRHLLSLNPLLARCRRYSRGER